ncbi:MAG: hypothetical protein JWQ33_1277 [Ramlibacter sp.]|nr:hypothetical protein [Ramlibacter sp.]
MNKLLATLIASLFVASTALAASHTGAPMAATPASGATSSTAATSATPAASKAKKAKKAKKSTAKKAAATDEKKS